MEKVIFTDPETKEKIEFYVLEETQINGNKFLFVTEEEDGDSDAYILYIPSYTTLKHQLYASATIPFLLNHSAYLISNTDNYCASTLTLFIFYNFYYTSIFFIMQ